MVIAIIGTGAVSASDVVGISDNSTGLMGCDNTSSSVVGDICFDESIISCDNYTDSSSVGGDEIAQKDNSTYSQLMKLLTHNVTDDDNLDVVY